jgi:hypothetical protein
VVTGDVTQTDLPAGRPSGLRHVLDVLRGVEGIGFQFFEARDVVRHPLVQRIVQAYDARSGDTQENGFRGPSCTASPAPGGQDGARRGGRRRRRAARRARLGAVEGADRPLGECGGRAPGRRP